MNEIGNDKHVQDTVEYKSALMVSESKIGVTNQIDDVMKFVQGAMTEGESFEVLVDYDKNMLLKQEQQILMNDEFDSSGLNRQMLFPQRQTGYNLLSRPIKKRIVLSFVAGKDDHDVANR